MEIMKKFIIISFLIVLMFVFISQCISSQKIVGHPYEVRGQYYDSNPEIPLMTQKDVSVASSGSVATIHDFSNFNDLYNQYSYQCFSLKNEGTTAFTTAQSAAAGTSRTEQMFNFYSISKDAIQREENCQESISVFQKHSSSFIFKIKNWNQLSNELNQNLQISRSDESKEITNYNNIASSFNDAIISCHNNYQVIGIDGMCHDISVAPNIYSA